MPHAAGRENVDSKPAEYVVVARRYRPQTFEELIGQGQVAQALTTAIATQRVGHAYLFTGARGVGKTSAARIFAKALNCIEGPTAKPCNQCDICRSVSTGEDMDVLEIDGASNRGIDEIRQLRSNVGIRPSRARFKIYIIDEVHMLTLPAFNALLKTLEEPPEHVKFIFCTTDPEKIPITILSRCQRFDFPPVDAGAIRERLRQIVASEGVAADDEALQLLARRANGSLRDSQSLLEQLLSSCPERLTVDHVHALLGTARSGQLAVLAGCVADGNVAGMFQELGKALNEGVDAGQLAEQLVGYFRDLMAAQVGCGPEMMLYTAAGDFESLRRLSQRMGLETLLAMVQILDQSVSRMRYSPHVRTLLEVALVRICRLENLDELSELISQLRQGGGVPPRSAAGVPAPRQAAEMASPAAVGMRSAEKKTAPREAVRAADAAAGDDPAGVNVIASATVEACPTDAGGIHDPHAGPAEPHVDWGGSVSPQENPDTASSGLSPSTAEQIWRMALERLGDMTADFARHAERLQVAGPQRLVAQFGPGYILHKESCERPDRRAKLEEALSQAAGHAVKLELELLPGEVARGVRPQPVPSARQRLREKEQHPLVRLAMEMFGAEIVRVDEPRGGSS